MKKLLLVLAAIAFLSTNLFAQSAEVVIFSQDGERFWVVIDGVLQNEEPKPRVVVSGLTKNMYRVKIIFEIEEIPDIDKSISTRDIDDNLVNSSYRIFKRRKGYAMWPHSWEEVKPDETSGETVSLQTEGQTVNPGTKPKLPVDDKPEETTIQQPTVVGNESITITMPDGTTITFAPGAVVDSQYVDYIEEEHFTEVEIVQPGFPETTPIQTEPDPDPVYNMPGYNGPIGCAWPMEDSSFKRALSSIENQSFESDMFDVAKQVTSNNCLLVSQVVDIIDLFGFESTKLDFAKFAYDYTYDIGNYYQVNDSFSFSSSTRELNQYINSRR